MKKISLILQAKDEATAIRELGRLGTLHVEHVREPVSVDLQHSREQAQKLDRIIEALGDRGQGDPSRQVGNWDEETESILSLLEKEGILAGKITQTQAEIARWQVWGEFDPQSVSWLAGHGAYLRFYEVPRKEFAKMAVPGGVALVVVGEKDGLVHCVTLARTAEVLPYPQAVLPQKGLRELKEEQAEDQERLQDIREQLRVASALLEQFRKVRVGLEQEIAFHQVRAGVGQAQELVYLKGFCPVDQVPALTAAARRSSWGLIVEEIGPDDQPPTLLRNPAWISLIRPVLNMINVIPGYRELDISAFFLIFFSIFFGILIGDAGYGTIFLLGTFAAHNTVGKKMKDKSTFYLVYVLSSCAIIWGLLTGTVFGSVLFGQVFKPVLPWLNEPKNLQLLCFLIGVTHLTLAHAWRFIIKLPSWLAAGADAGWIMVLWCSFFMARMMILGADMPSFVPALFIAGMVLILLDMVFVQSRSQIGVNLILLVFSVINTFTDVVSYIRLFAVGFAGVAVADAFNQMALGIGFGSVFSGLGAVLILAFVHLFLNLLLCAMGVLVHGVRLNVLEFSGHLSMEWSGTKYDPFKL